MVSTLNTLLLGTTLAVPSRQRLIAWMKDCKTGLDRLRAGLPADWVTGDKTGTGDGGRAGSHRAYRGRRVRHELTYDTDT